MSSTPAMQAIPPQIFFEDVEVGSSIPTLVKTPSNTLLFLYSAATWKATALRIVAEREPKGPDRNRAIAAANKAVRKALRITKKYRACSIAVKKGNCG